MSDDTKALLNKYGIFIIFGVLAVLIGILAIVSSVQQSQGIAYRSISKEEANLEKASSDMVTVSLDGYYANKGRYPVDYDALVAHYDGETKDYLLKSQVLLKDFEYTRRGDEQAYKFTYTSKSGEKKSVEGQYRKDYN